MSYGPEIAALTEKYLEQLNYTLWADWDISRPDRRKLAAEWFASEVRKVFQFADMNFEGVAHMLAANRRHDSQLQEQQLFGGF